ncbi:MAG: hypothetical protein J3R72DRAFT_506713 [Linnemannia gamsii]|nr:MAG: hypothetical protein J3R72DRAFT_506713 [Linnemannia gamsii]
MNGFLSLLADQAAQEPGMVEDVSRSDRPSFVEETRLFLEVTEEAIDEVDKEAEEEQQQASPTAQDPSRPKGPSRNHLKTLQAITKILLESPELDVQRLNSAWVRRTAHKPEELTDVECLVVVRIVKALSPYTPKRVKNSSGGTSPPTPNPASMIKVVLLSSHMLRYTCKYKLKFGFRMTFVNSILDEAKKGKRMKRGGHSQQPVQSTTNKNEQEQLAASNLRQAKETADTAFLDWLQREEELRTTRATRYALQRISTTRPNNDPPSNNANYDARPTWTKLCKLDTSVTTTLSDVTQSIRQYTVVTKNRFELLAAVDKLEECKSSEEQQQATIKLPPVHHITAPQMGDLAFTTKNQRQRERRLAADTPEADAARSTLGALSSTSINAVLTLEDVDHAQNTRRACRQPCRDFENTR